MNSAAHSGVDHDPRHRRIARWLLAGAAALAGAQGSPGVAHAALPASLDGRWEIGIAPLYAYLLDPDRGDAQGGGAQLFVRYGLSDAVALQVSGLWTVHAVADLPDVPDSGGTLQVLSASAGVSYALDITRFVPRLEAGAGVLHRRFAEQTSTDMAITVGIGVDYLLNRWISLGAAFHYHAVVTHLQDLPVYVDVGPRVVFGWR